MGIPRSGEAACPVASADAPRVEAAARSRDQTPLVRGFCLPNLQKNCAMCDSARNKPGIRCNYLIRIVPRTHDFDAKEFDKCAVVTYNGHHRRSVLRRCVQEEWIMRCLFTHKWVIGKEFNVRSNGHYVRSVLPYRTCERCGTMQRGIYKTLWRDIAWETMRERNYIKSQQYQIFRQPPSTRLNKLAHSLGLRRSRMRIETILGKRPSLTRS